MQWVVIGSFVSANLLGLAGVLLAISRRARRGPANPLENIHVEMTTQLATELERNLKEAFQAQVDIATSQFATSLGASSKSISDTLGSVSTKVVDEEVAKFQQTLEALRTTSGSATDQLKSATDQVLQEISAATTKLSKQLEQASQGSYEAVSKASSETMTGVNQTVAATMKQLQDASAGTLAKISAEAEATSTQLHASMKAEVAAEQRLLVASFDSRMADIITSYLAEALGGGIDIGTQHDYVMKTLEEHRDDIKRDLLGEA